MVYYGVYVASLGVFPLYHGLKETTMLQPITQEKFDELVTSTTKYLQILMDRTADLEKRLEALEAKKGAKKDG